ncbi:hypothetical protein HDU97_006284 [Phlyctochytrium planicorne]|nr:hypothetical protein HDU97_006284 [Phlyctochytrium planicorne]
MIFIKEEAQATMASPISPIKPSLVASSKPPLRLAHPHKETCVNTSHPSNMSPSHQFSRKRSRPSCLPTSVMPTLEHDEEMRARAISILVDRTVEAFMEVVAECGRGFLCECHDAKREKTKTTEEWKKVPPRKRQKFMEAERSAAQGPAAVQVLTLDSIKAQSQAQAQTFHQIPAVAVFEPWVPLLVTTSYVPATLACGTMSTVGLQSCSVWGAPMAYGQFGMITAPFAATLPEGHALVHAVVPTQIDTKRKRDQSEEVEVKEEEGLQLLSPVSLEGSRTSSASSPCSIPPQASLPATPPSSPIATPSTPTIKFTNPSCTPDCMSQILPHLRKLIRSYIFIMASHALPSPQSSASGLARDALKHARSDLAGVTVSLAKRILAGWKDANVAMTVDAFALGVLMVAEAECGDVQTSTGVWVEVAGGKGLEMLVGDGETGRGGLRRAVARCKMGVLVGSDWEFGVLERGLNEL